MKNTVTMAMITTIIAAGSFYAGMVYGRKQPSQSTPARGGFANLSPEERQARVQQFGGRASGRGGAAGFVTGEILSKDANGVTIKLRDGGSKIVFVSTTTQILKSTTGSLNDLSAGTQVMVAGSANADGSMSAQSIQVRPPMPVPSASATPSK